MGGIGFEDCCIDWNEICGIVDFWGCWGNGIIGCVWISGGGGGGGGGVGIWLCWDYSVLIL